MAIKPIRVKNFAKKYKIEVDVALIKLWDKGFLYLNNKDSFIKGKDLFKAKTIFGSRALSENKKVTYWAKKFEMKKDEFINFCISVLGLQIRKNTKKLPAYAISIIKSYANKEGGEQSSPYSSKPVEYFIKDSFLYIPSGHKTQDIRYIKKEEIIKIHEELTKDLQSADDPIFPKGIRSEGLIESAVARQATSYDGRLKYTTIESCAAAITHSLVLNHAFHNGNKRTALVVLLVFLDFHSLILNCNEDELFKFVMKIATIHENEQEKKDIRNSEREIDYINRWIVNNSRKANKKEQPITLYKFKRLLASYDCKIDIKADKIYIERIIETKGRFFGIKKRKVYSQMHKREDGAEMSIKLIKKVRAELELDEEHMIDSDVFYNYGLTPTSEFIIRYRKLLKRLSRY